MLMALTEWVLHFIFILSFVFEKFDLKLVHVCVQSLFEVFIFRDFSIPSNMVDLIRGNEDEAKRRDKAEAVRIEVFI